MTIAETNKRSLTSDRRERRLTRIALTATACLVAAAVISTVAMNGRPSPGVAAALSPTVPSSRAQTASFESPISTSTANVGDKLVEYAENTEPASASLNALTPTQSGLALDMSSAFTRETDNGSLILRIPYVPTVNLLDISGYTVMFNPDGSIASRAEVVYQAQTAHSGRVALWQDGQLKLDQVVSDGAEPATAGTAHSAFNWDTLNKCLTSAGIAQWALIAIGVACGVICGATLGIGCAACVAAAGGIIGSTAGECVAKAMIS